MRIQANTTWIAHTTLYSKPPFPLVNALLLECKTRQPSVLRNDTLRDTILIFIANLLKLLYELKGVLVAYATTNRALKTL